jgi:DNA primase (bacterial type)
MDRNMETEQDARRAGRRSGGDNFASAELILSYTNIVDEVSGFVKLKKVGNNYSGLCPFHSEKTPSFYVNESKGLYYCFGCGKGGNVIGFLKDIRGESFGEVVRYLKQKYNIPLEDTKYYKTNNSQKDEEPLKKILKPLFKFLLRKFFSFIFRTAAI